MRKLLFLFTLLCLNLNAQTYNFTGKVSDDSNTPLENATVSLIREKDSSIINYTGTNKNGNFSFKVPAQTEPSVLQISSDKFRSFSKRLAVINKDEEVGSIALIKDLVTNIEEVQLTASPVRIKKDTVEYTASYIKVKPDAKIDDLLKEIPGVETDEDGRITINGQPVNKILINGKPFFNKDGSVALQTFPADIIKKIQFTTSKSREEEYTGRTPKSDSMTVNFNIDEKNNKGNLNNLSLGYGTNKRYEGNLFMTRFKGDRNIALIAASNNINTTGFSVDSFFDSGGGKSKNAAVNGRAVNSGILRTSMLGINYADKIGGNLDLEKLSLQYNDSNLETYSKTSRTTFLPEYKLDKNSERSGNADTRKFNANTDANIRIDPLTNVIISANFANTSTDSETESSTFTLRDDENLNRNQSSVRGSSENNNFSPTIALTRRFQKPGRSFSASLSNTFAQSVNRNYNLQETQFFQTPEDNDYRNQFLQTRNSRNIFGANVKYYEPISDSATISLEMNFDHQNLTNERTVNDFNQISEQYSDFNALLSNTLNQNNNFLNTEINYNLNKENLNFRAGANLNYSRMSLNSIYNQDNILTRKNFVLPEYNVMLQYKFSKTKSLRITNNATYTLPQASELNPFIDISNPVNTFQGNKDLKSIWQNTSNINYNSADLPRGINFNARLNFSYTDNDIVDFSQYDAVSGRQFSTFVNISGNKRLGLNTSFTKTYKWNGNRLTLSPNLSSSYNYRRGFVDGAQFTNDIYDIYPRLNVKLNWKDKMDIRSSFGINYSYSHYTNYSLDKTKIANQNISLGTTNYFLKKDLFWENDFRYTNNSNISAGFNRASYFWNSSLTYQFYKKQMMLKFKVYDLLNQRQNITRTIGDNYVEDKEELILRRYFMLTLIFKFNKIGGNKS